MYNSIEERTEIRRARESLANSLTAHVTDSHYRLTDIDINRALVLIALELHEMNLRGSSY